MYAIKNKTKIHTVRLEHISVDQTSSSAHALERKQKSQNSQVTVVLLGIWILLKAWGALVASVA